MSATDLKADAVVIGGGGAGLAAAAEAAAAGARVVLLEKNARLGGSTAWSVGSISATRTPHQKAAGITDHPDLHFEDLEILAGRYANRDNRELRRVLVDHTTEMMTWLADLGIEFVGPNPEPPHRVSRMHNVVPNSRAFPHFLGRRCRKLGVDIRLGTRAATLLRDEARVTGVKCVEDNGCSYTIGASAGIILAAGDYSASEHLKAELASPEVAELEPVNPTATGDGFLLGRMAGGVIVNGDIVRGPILRFIPPPSDSLLRRLPPSRILARTMRWAFENLPESMLRPFAMSFLTTALGPSTELFRDGAILVDRDGHRFTDELDQPARRVPSRDGKQAFIVFDSRVARMFEKWPKFISTAPGIAYAYLADYRRNRRDIFHEADTVFQLAREIGADPAALDAACLSMRTPAEPPYFALGPVRSYVVFTDGGLAVDTDHRVLDAAGQPISGLYAAGSNGQGGLLLEGHGHHLAWAFISGRRAARHLVKTIKTQSKAA